MSAAKSHPLQRRCVKYRGYEMIVDDAERIAAGRYETVGNWSFAQILDHLVKAFTASIDGPDERMSLPMRLFGRLFLKGRFLNKTLPGGLKFPDGAQSRFAPVSDIALDEALASFRQVIQRCKSERQRALHPLFGNLDRAEWDRFNLRHAELHMSFVVPIGDTSVAAPETVHKESINSHAK